ncbi:hypothetical protein EW093_07320 [Thiospirochaeta perfilievii]|uniref:LamG domain-containing protein n=1 Tax=Thiospirochaeta perfilievii TaxID=252967 RepID=A0A5C1QAL4_9SPIO|nr:hypothetical protein [Thiospirochaeta perfilievii]QEN04517.1 hypothetical protein EW093_07320 [Thiospirochaeta perfilievii]
MKVFLIVLFSVLITSCSNISLETDPIIVKTIRNGEVLSEGDTFDITFLKSSDSVLVNPTSAKIEISYNNSRSLGDNEFQDVDPINFDLDFIQNEEVSPTFKISSDFKNGLYSLFVNIYEDDEIISSFNSQFIVYSGELRGDVVGIFPNKNLYSKSVAILESKIHHDISIDPYLVWKLDGTIIKEGYLSQGVNKLLWDTEELYGFIDISLDLLPYKLDDVTHPSRNSVNFSFIVNPLYKSLYSEADLSPYYKSLFFNGNYYDELNKDLYIENYGEKLPNYVDRFYGMTTGPSRGFKSNDSIFPVDKVSGDLLNFSVILDFMPLLPDDGNIFTTQYKNLINRLYIENGSILHSFGYTDDISSEILGIVDINDPQHLVISFIRSPNGYKVLYYLDGELIRESFWEFSLTELNDGVFDSFIFGGDMDFSGASTLVDTFNVYYLDEQANNNIYPDNYSDSIPEKESYIVLEGFNSVTLPQNFSGNGSIDGEILSMAAGSILSFSEILFDDIDSKINIKVLGDSRYTLALYNDDVVVYEGELVGESTLSLIGRSLYIDSTLVTEVTSNYNRFDVKAIDSCSIDSLFLESIGNTVE